ncbi:hypothetical protein C0J52_02033 [Blattella germanica]|nr:hypothetical protein C0J52_02033 [Blattella germanica]
MYVLSLPAVMFGWQLCSCKHLKMASTRYNLMNLLVPGCCSEGHRITSQHVTRTKTISDVSCNQIQKDFMIFGFLNNILDVVNLYRGFSRVFQWFDQRVLRSLYICNSCT